MITAVFVGIPLLLALFTIVGLPVAYFAKKFSSFEDRKLERRPIAWSPYSGAPVKWEKKLSTPRELV